MAEEQIYESGLVSVTRSIVRINSASYVVSNIGAVWIEPPKPEALYLTGILAGLFGIAGRYLDAVLVSYVFFGLAYIFCMIGRAAPYVLFFRMSGGDTAVLSSNDMNALESIKASIESAVARRG